MTITRGDYVTMQTGGFWELNPAYPAAPVAPRSGAFASAQYSSTATPVADTLQFKAARFFSMMTGGDWRTAYDAAALPALQGGAGSWGYAADQLDVVTDVEPTDWPFGWDFGDVAAANGPWPPGWPKTATGLTVTVTAPATLNVGDPATIEVKLLIGGLPAAAALGQVLRLTALLGGVNMPGVAHSYLMAQYDGVNYGILEVVLAVTMALTAGDAGKTIVWTAESLSTAPQAEGSANTLVVAGGCL